MATARLSTILSSTAAIIPINRDVYRALGDLHAAYFLQHVWWAFSDGGHMKAETAGKFAGFALVDIERLRKEMLFSDRKFERARAAVLDTGVIVEIRRGIPSRLWWAFDPVRLLSWWEEAGGDRAQTPDLPTLDVSLTTQAAERRQARSRNVEELEHETSSTSFSVRRLEEEYQGAGEAPALPAVKPGKPKAPPRTPTSRIEQRSLLAPAAAAPRVWALSDLTGGRCDSLPRAALEPGAGVFEALEAAWRVHWGIRGGTSGGKDRVKAWRAALAEGVPASKLARAVMGQRLSRFHADRRITDWALALRGLERHSTAWAALERLGLDRPFGEWPYVPEVYDPGCPMPPGSEWNDYAAQNWAAGYGFCPATREWTRTPRFPPGDDLT